MSGVIKTNLIKESNVLMLLCVLHLIIEIKLVEERNRYTVCKQLSIFLKPRANQETACLKESQTLPGLF